MVPILVDGAGEMSCLIVRQSKEYGAYLRVGIVKLDTSIDKVSMEMTRNTVYSRTLQVTVICHAMGTSMEKPGGTGLL